MSNVKESLGAGEQGVTILGMLRSLTVQTPYPLRLGFALPYGVRRSSFFRWRSQNEVAAAAAGVCNAVAPIHRTRDTRKIQIKKVSNGKI